MAGLLRNLLDRFNRTPRSAFVNVALFGKHPGAADHFEVIPPEDTVLNELWRLIYRKPMEELVAGWSQLTEQDKLAEFHHLWFWSHENQWVAGRMWSSTDTGGRAHFPLIAAVHGQGPVNSFVTQAVLPALEQIERECRQTDSLSDVKAMLEQVKGELSERAAEALAPLTTMKELLGAAAENGDPQPLHRLLLPFRSELMEEKDSAASKILGAAPVTHSLRMPRVLESAERAMIGWNQLLTRLCGSDATMLIIAPVDFPWVDILVGNISTAGLYCIKTSLDRRGMSSDGEQTISNEFAGAVDRFVNSAGVAG